VAIRVEDIGDLTITFEEVGYVHFHFKKSDKPVGASLIKKALEILKKELKQKACLLVSTEEGATLSQDARDFASSESFDEYILADAIIRANYSHEMAANFFIRFNRPNRPVKLFPSKEKALTWIAEIQDQANN
jgi:hypothetical protein